MFFTSPGLFLCCKPRMLKFGIQLGDGLHSNLGCHDMFLKVVSLLKNYRSDGGRSIHFWNFGKLSALAFQKYHNH